MNKYKTIIKNDIVNGEGVVVSFWVQGCPHHCPGCFNPETWSFKSGNPYTKETRKEIIEAISANNIQRNFSVLGGEPLASENLEMTEDIVRSVRAAYPDIKIYLWTGYEFDKLPRFAIFDFVDVIIDGPFIKDLKNLDLKLRGSSNQRIWIKENNLWRQTNG